MCGEFIERLCWESTGFSLGPALAAAEEAMIHAANKQELTGFNMLYCAGITMAWQLLSFI